MQTPLECLAYSKPRMAVAEITPILERFRTGFHVYLSGSLVDSVGAEWILLPTWSRLGFLLASHSLISQLLRVFCMRTNTDGGCGCHCEQAKVSVFKESWGDWVQ